MKHRPDEWGIHVDITQEGACVLGVVTVPTSKTETQTYYLRAPSQTLLLELIRPFLRIPK